SGSTRRGSARRTIGPCPAGRGKSVQGRAGGCRSRRCGAIGRPVPELRSAGHGAQLGQYEPRSIACLRRTDPRPRGVRRRKPPTPDRVSSRLHVVAPEMLLLETELLAGLLV